MPGARDVAAAAARSRLFGRAVRLADRLTRWPNDWVAVLTYHRVDEIDARPDLHPGLLSATPIEFDAQMRLVRREFEPIDAATLVAALQGGPRLPRRAVLVTFDDAYDDFARQAWPILRRERIPAVLFVPTAYPDRPDRAFWWDRLHAATSRIDRPVSIPTPSGSAVLEPGPGQQRALAALFAELKRQPHAAAMAMVDRIVAGLGSPIAQSSVLSWNELRRLAGEGLALALHTRWHPILDQVDDPGIEDEIGGGMGDLVREVGQVAPLLAYPSGVYDPRAALAAGAAGLVAAFTTARGGNDIGRDDLFRLRRTNVGRWAGAQAVHAELLPQLSRLLGRFA